MSIKLMRNIFSAAAAVLMVVASCTFGDKEIIFPEIVALLIGMWVSETQPWIVSKPTIIISMSLSAITGITITNYIQIHLLLQLLIAFVFVGTIAIISRSNFYPMISACLLPILLGTKSIVYPISVIIMTLIIVLVRILFEKVGYVKRVKTTTCNFQIRDELIKWIKLILGFVSVTSVCSITGNKYFIIPPIIVIFVTLSNVESPLRKNPKKLIILSATAACIGAFARMLFLCFSLTSLIFSATVAIIAILLLLNLNNTLLPPLGAIAFLPLILPLNGLWFYPIQVTIGTAIFTFIAFILFPDLNHKANNDSKLSQKL